MVRRYPGRSKGYRKKRAYGLASKKYVNKLVKKVASKVETKYLSTSEALTVDYGGVIRKLTGVAQGGADYQRLGDQIQMKSLTIRFAPSNMADTFNILRCIIFKWTQDDNVTSPYPSTLLNSTGYTTAPLSAWVFDAMRAKKFKVLYDKTFDLNQDLSVADKLPKVIHLKIKNKINFFASTVNGTGHIYMLLISDSGLAPHPIINYVSQAFFTDE